MMSSLNRRNKEWDRERMSIPFRFDKMANESYSIYRDLNSLKICLSVFSFLAIVSLFFYHLLTCRMYKTRLKRWVDLTALHNNLMAIINIWCLSIYAHGLICIFSFNNQMLDIQQNLQNESIINDEKKATGRLAWSFIIK